jgi:hypothetical protein
MDAHALKPWLWGRRAWLVPAGLLLLGAIFIDVSIVEPRVHVRWRDDVTLAERRVLEEQYRLEAAEPVDGATWRYELHDRSPENVGALVQDGAVADTGYIDRETLAVPDREVEVSAHRLRQFAGPAPLEVLQLQSVILIAAGAALLWVSTLTDARRRRALAVAALLAVGAAAYALPLRQPIRMGDADTYTVSRESFETFAGVRQIRYEAHLSHAILGRLDAIFGRTEGSPARALRTLMQGATAWFLVMALAVGALEAWSPMVVRYLALAVIGPSALMYFGYRELGHLSLNMAVFPLLVRGLGRGTRHLEAGGALAGFGAALHGFGLLSIAGAALAAVVPLQPCARSRHTEAPRHRANLNESALKPDTTYPGREGTSYGPAVLRVLAFGVAAYIGWVAIYLIVLKLPVTPGHAEAIPLRPWLADEIGDRVNVAILSLRGARDVSATALLVGLPLLAVAASLRRRFPFETRAALLYALPSAVFVILFWPIQGLAVEADLLFAAFPALYALAWVCAHDHRRAIIAAVILTLAHVVFWRVMLDSAFVNSRI